MVPEFGLLPAMGLIGSWMLILGWDLVRQSAAIVPASFHYPAPIHPASTTGIAGFDFPGYLLRRHGQEFGNHSNPARRLRELLTDLARFA
jgi:hypothetical protein